MADREPRNFILRTRILWSVFAGLVTVAAGLSAIYWGYRDHMSAPITSAGRPRPAESISSQMKPKAATPKENQTDIPPLTTAESVGVSEENYRSALRARRSRRMSTRGFRWTLGLHGAPQRPW